ncbi:GNAT family N-acetyltransferase [Mesobaculum littorinae]|uniref:GNAT family N-acetyltransferase n=1 Tax=Mesobaculum littorinae TaxID=2486419 RepID=UPI0013E3DDB2|nr:GNAT family N-acetyltransferase [Mesobaculum littorinae]
MRIAPTRDLAACHALRRTVFMDEQGFTEAEEFDGRDDGAVHLLAMEDAAPVGTARLLQEGEIGRIGRICVLRSHRGTGLGAALVRAAIAELRAQPDIRIIRLSAQVQAMGFYEKLGFVAHGESYLDGTVPHRDMDLQMPARDTPA